MNEIEQQEKSLRLLKLSVAETKNYASAVRELEGTIKRMQSRTVGALKMDVPSGKTLGEPTKKQSPQSSFTAAKELAGSVGDALNGVTALTQALGENKSAVDSISKAYAAFKATLDIFSAVESIVQGIKGMSAALSGAKVAQDALNASQVASPWGWVALAIGAVAAAAVNASEKQKELYAESERVKQKILDIQNGYEQAKNTASDAFQKQLYDIKDTKHEYDQLKNMISQGVQGSVLEDAIQRFITRVPEAENLIRKVNDEWQLMEGNIDAIIKKKELEAEIDYLIANRTAARINVDKARKEYETASGNLVNVEGKAEYDLAIEKIKKYERKTRKGEALSVDELNDLEIAKTTRDVYGGPVLAAMEEVERLRQTYGQLINDEDAIQAEIDELRYTPEEPSNVSKTPDWAVQMMSEGEKYRTQVNDADLAQQFINQGEYRAAGKILGMDNISTKEQAETAVQKELKDISDSIAANQLSIANQLTPEQIAAMSEAEKKVYTNYVNQLQEVLNSGTATLDWLKTWNPSINIQVDGASNTVQRIGQKYNPLTHKFYAKGTNYYPGGVGIVGENGPELVKLPQGSKITPNNRLAGELRNLGNLAVTVSGNQFVVREQADIDRIADALARKIRKELMASA